MKNALSAHSVNSTQRIVQYTRDDEEADNERNMDLDRNQNDNDDDFTGGTLNINCISHSSSGSSNKYTALSTQTNLSSRTPFLSGTSELRDCVPHCLVGAGTIDTSCNVQAWNITQIDGGGFSNPSLCTSPSNETQNQTAVKPKDTFVQHTFHFPSMAECEGKNKTHLAGECKKLSNINLDSEEEESDDANANYGHFVPLSQVLQNDKHNQILQRDNLIQDKYKLLNQKDLYAREHKQLHLASSDRLTG